MAINEQSSDEELLRKEINRITAILRDLRKSGIKLNESNLKAIQGMAKTADQWGKTLTIEKSKNQRLEETARRMKDNHAWLDKHTETIRKNRAVQQANSIEKQREHQQDVQTNIKMRNIQAKAGEQMDFFTKALTGGVTVGTIFEKMGGSVYRLSKQFELLDEVIRQTAEIEQLKAQNLDPSGEKKLGALERARTSNVNALGGEKAVADMQEPSAKNKFGKSLGAMGKFAKKHAMGMALGVGAGGLILSTIIKALSVAPMFQAMMKLFKFAVTMILMPIGTFFGAILRPIMIGLIKTIAPQFKGWMKTAMKLGDQVGKFIMDFFTDPAKYLLGAMGGIIPMIVSAFSFPDWSSWNPFDDGKSQEEKDQEHTEYWEGVNKSLEDAWNSIYTPIEEFAMGVHDFFTVTIPEAFSGVWNSLQDIGKMILTPFLMFIGTINTIFLWQLPMMFEDFWTWVSSGFENLQSALTEWLQPILDFLGYGTTEDDMNRAEEASKAVADAMGKVENFFDKIFGNTENSKDHSDEINELWQNITGHTQNSEDNSNTTEHAMESIAKIFDSAASWISNALRRVSNMRYTKADGSTEPTAEAKIAKKTLNEGVPMIMAGGSIKDWYSSFQTAGNGFSGMVNSPTMFMAGEAGAEHISISPHGSKSSGGAVININIAKIERDADFNQLKPMIQRWILEANSRRGMI